MGALLQDLRYALRALGRSPGFTSAAVLALALGIGASTAIFSLVEATLLRPLPYRDPDHLVWLWSSRVDRDKAPLSIPDYLDFRGGTRTLESSAAFATWGANLTGAGDPERIQGTRIEAGAFSLLGATAAIGRTLEPEDGRPDRPRVAVLAHGLWLRRFGGDPRIVGRTIPLNGDAYTVVGVLPRSFFFPLRDAEVGVPLVFEGDPRSADRGDHFLRAIARLRPGVSPARAERELTTLARRLQTAFPVSNAKNQGVRVVRLHEEIAGNFRPALLVLLGAVLLLLLIACSNIANLLLARASTRRREIGIRMAQGATRARIVRQLLTEGAVLALFGGSAGVLLASWGLPMLAAASPVDLPRVGDVGLDAGILAFAIAASAASVLAFGLAPALYASAADPSELLRGGRAATAGPGGASGRGAILVAEVALSFVLLNAAGLLIRSFGQLQAVRPGFDPAGVLTLRLSLPKTAYVSADDVARFDERVRERLRTIPGVTGAGDINFLPLTGGFASVDFAVVGQEPPPPDRVPAAQYRIAGPGYFEAMRIPLRSGRLFSDRDTSRSPRVALVNETMARRFFGGRSPIGERLAVEESASSEVEIVGVVGDVRHMSLEAEPGPDIYVPLAQASSSAVVYLRNTLYCVLHGAGDPLAMAAAARRSIQEIDHDVAATTTRSLEQLVADSVAPRRFSLRLVSVFGIAALLLACAGLYGVMAYSVAQRAREVGIRMALGASAGDVSRLFLGRGLRLALAGTGVGVALSLGTSRLIVGQLFRVRPADPAALAAATALLFGVALVASWWPARRASRVDPTTALRSE